MASDMLRFIEPPRFSTYVQVVHALNEESCRSARKSMCVYEYGMKCQSCKGAYRNVCKVSFGCDDRASVSRAVCETLSHEGSGLRDLCVRSEVQLCIERLR